MTPPTTTRRAVLRAGVAIGAAPLLHLLDGARRGGLGAHESWDDVAVGCCARPSDAAAIAAAGGDFVELSCTRDLADAATEEELAERLLHLRALDAPPRAANTFLPGRLRCTGPDADHDAVLAYAERTFARANAVGIDTITFGSAAARTPPAGFPLDDARLQLVALLARLAEPAREHAVTLCLEPLRAEETTLVNTVAEGLRLVRAVDHPNVRLTADLYHEFAAERPASDLLEAAPFVHHVHVAEPASRRPPGSSADAPDLLPWFAALREGGFRGRVSVEARFGDDFGSEIASAVRSVRDTLRRAQEARR
ncbi:MAG: sugar phosphate isomerase/epimerase family protein [Planctomycetota bacterium]